MMRHAGTNHPSLSAGFTLIELMIAIGVVAIIASIAVPAYFGYIRIARIDTMEYNMRTLRVLLEDARLENGAYGAAGPPISGVGTISAAYDWEPDSDLSHYNFTLSVTAADNYDLWMVDTRSGTWRRCDNRMARCCDGDDGNPTACP